MGFHIRRLGSAMSSPFPHRPCLHSNPENAYSATGNNGAERRRVNTRACEKERGTEGEERAGPASKALQRSIVQTFP